MAKVIVACVQQRMRIYESHEEYRQDVHRFLQMAVSKGALLAVFPELSGLMLAPPLISGLRVGLLRTADRESTQPSSVLGKMVGKVAGSAASALGGLGRGLLALLNEHSRELESSYLEVFSQAARHFKIYIVGGSLYLHDETKGATRHVSYLFAPDGRAMGRQEKVSLYLEDENFCTPGESFHVFPTEIGRLGILIGTESLYPESARILAFQGAEALINIAACPGEALFNKVHHAFQARVQENQLLGVQSFLVGKNTLSQISRADYVGRSAIFAPLEMTKQNSGVLVEVGALSSEGLIAAVWDFDALRALWENSDTPLRRTLNASTYRRHLPGIYAQGRTIEEIYAALSRRSTPEKDADKK
mgnify:CR=1 FL=1